MKTHILTSEVIEDLVLKIGLNQSMDILINRLTNAFTSFDPEKIELPIRSGFHYNSPKQGLIEWMPIYQKGGDVTIKVVGYHPDNPDDFQLPTIVSTISKYDTKTGHLKAMVDGVLLTALRTGAASAVATKLFAHPDSTILGIIGCGAQSITQLHAISRIFPLKKVMYYDADVSTQASFMTRVKGLGLDLVLEPTSIAEIVKNVDILCTATSLNVGEGPLFDNIETKPHLHINAVGSDFPGKIEVPKSYLENAFVSPDFKEQAMKEGECQQLEDSQIGESLFECLKHREKFEKFQEQKTIFDSTGLSLEDMVVMELFLEHADIHGLGMHVNLESIPQDAKNPYHFAKEKVLVDVKGDLVKELGI